MFRQNLKHTGLSPYDTSGNIGWLKWSFETGDYVFSSPAISSDDSIYIGSTDYNLYAINRNGTKKWNFPTSNKIHSSPAIDTEGTIFVGSKDGKLYAINPDGIEKWNFTTNSLVDSSPAIGSDGTIYIGSNDYKLYAINPDGSKKWSFQTGKEIDDSSPAIGSDGTIYIGSLDFKLYAIKPDGTKKWSYTTGSSIFSSPVIGHDGTIYIGSEDDKLHAINPDGTKKWSFTTGNNIYSSPAIGSDGTIYVGSTDNKLYAINPDGTEKWNFLTDFIVESSPSIGSDGTIYVGSKDNKLYAINPDGTKKWSFTTDDGILSSPAIGSDGTIYVGSYDGKLYAIGTQNIPPIAIAGPDQTRNEGDIVQLDASTSYDPDGTIESYEWDFESNGIYDYQETPTNAPDGTFDGKTEHIYGDNGVYIVTLRVTDDASDTDTDFCVVTVNNVAPTITLMMTYPDDEGSMVTFEAESTDPGSDDITYSWELEYGPIIENIDYNGGISPEPVYDPTSNEVKSPYGTYPFHTSDVATYIYGDNYDYTIILTVADDDNGETTYTTTVTVDNLAPTIIEMNIPSQVDEGSSALFKVLASDQGSDDLTFTWDFEQGPTITNVHYNDGVGLDPYPSPWGDYPFDVWDIVYHSYGDDGVYGIDLTIEDDDGEITTYSTDINVRNVAPTIDTATAPGGDEGAVLSYLSTATDQGTDDLTFTWYWGDGTLDTMNIHYNDGAGPDPPQSPMGAYPFTATNTVSHIYGDDGNYTITLTVGDDDGGLATYTTTVTINNVAPTIEPFGPFTVDEGSSLELTTTSTDPGSDDLIFTWVFELGPTITNIYYNDGLGPDPYPSPWGVFPFNVADTVSHTYGDNGIYTLMLTVEDDDGAVDIFTTNVTVNNVAPAIVNLEAYMYVNFSLRVAGEKYHSVGIHIVEDGEEISSAVVTRYPGNPDEQTGSITGVKIDMTKNYIILVDYLPNDPRVNGNVWGGNPVWIDITFENGSVKRLHHTFNVRQSYWESDHWNHIVPWEVELNSYLIGHSFEIISHISDPGSDDETLIYEYCSQVVTVNNLNNPPNPDPYPSPEVNPRSIFDTITLVYEGSGTLSLIVEDDDGGICVLVLIID